MEINKRLQKNIEVAIQARRKIEQEGRRGKEPYLKRISDALDEYYFYNKLKVYCGYLSYSLIINPQKIDYTRNDFLLMQMIVPTIESKLIKNKVIRTYLCIKELYDCINNKQNNSDQLLEETLNSIASSIELVSKQEGIELYSFLTNLCTWMLNSTTTPEHKKEYYSKKYLIAAIGIIKLEIEDKSKKIKKIPAQLFRNIVTISINLLENSFFNQKEIFHIKEFSFKNELPNKLDWINAFIGYFKNGLPDKESDVYYLYCKALVEFKKGNHKISYSLLKKNLHKQELFTSLSLRILYLMVLFELELEEPEFLDLENIDPNKEVENYRNLVKYEKITRQKMNYHLDYFNTFNKFYLKLIRLYNRLFGNNIPEKKDLEEKSDFLKELNMGSYSYKNWFLQKLEEIE